MNDISSGKNEPHVGSGNPGQAVPLDEFPGVPLEYAEVLKSRGIMHSLNLLNATGSGEDRKQLAIDTGIPVRRIEELRALCSLTEIPAVGPAMARLFYHAGFRSVKALAESDAEMIKEQVTGACKAYPDLAGSLKGELLHRCLQEANAKHVSDRKKEQHR